MANAGLTSALRRAALLVILAAIASSAAVVAAKAASRASAPASRPAAAGEALPGTCVVHSLPSFVAQGEFSLTATAADIIEVECDPYVYGTGSRIRITASQLYSRCHESLTWYVVSPFRVERGRGVSVELDADGNATVAVLAGPECQAGESLVAAHMEEEPFETFTTSFAVLPPANTAPGVYALPASQVEDARSSSVATIVEAEFAGGSEKPVRIASEELYQRCRRGEHLLWVRMNGEIASGPEVREVVLDNNGNAFVIALGEESCAEGTSLIEADLEAKPFTTFTTEFTILSPQPTGEPSFTIEKRQQLAGSVAGPTTAPLTGSVGQTVSYEIVVTNNGKVAETFTDFTDAHCDSGTIAGGPGSSSLAPGGSSTYTCSQLLTAPGAYANEASVTANTVGGAPLTKTSNRVLVEVPAPPSPETTVPAEAAPKPSLLAPAPPAPSPPGKGGVLGRCEASRPVLRGLSGPKRAPFTVKTSAIGNKQAVFYVDGRYLKTLAQPQARAGQFAISVDPRRLSYGAHKFSVKVQRTNPNCAAAARSGVFVHSRNQRAAPKFTG